MRAAAKPRPTRIVAEVAGLTRRQERRTSLLTALVLGDGDPAGSERSARSVLAVADDVVVLERSEVDWSDSDVTQSVLDSVAGQWILVLGAGEVLRLTSPNSAREALLETTEDFVGLWVGLSAEVRIHRNNASALETIGSAADDPCREMSIATSSRGRNGDVPGISVIIPTFNRPDMLRRCLSGLCVQTTDEFEVIVVNDGGLDVLEVVKEFAEQLDIALITQPHNGGPAVAANTGLATARGRYAHFQADDDTILPQHLELLRSALDETHAAGEPAGVVYGPAFLLEEGEDGSEIGRRVIYAKEGSTDLLMCQNFIVGGTAMFDRAIAMEIGGMNTDLEVLEDWDFWLRMSKRADIVFVDVPTAEYRMRGGTTNLTTQAKPRFYANLLKLYESHPVAPGSQVAMQREVAIRSQAESHRDSHAWEHTVAVVGDGDLDQMVGCLQSVSKVTRGVPIQLLIHEMRSPEAERLLADLVADATVCFHAESDESLIQRRIERQSGGRCVTVLRSSQRLVATMLVQTMREALEPSNHDLVELQTAAPDLRTIDLDYPTDPRPRHGYGRPVHSALAEMLARGDERYGGVLDDVVRELDLLVDIPVDRGVSAIEPYWNNDFFMGLDAAVLYTMIAVEQPRHYIEIGSGNSTRFVRRSIDDHGMSTRITSIDPEPRADCDSLCDEVIRSTLESTPLDVFDRVEPGDVVFYDGSHRALMNSDTTVFFLEVLPGLPAGTLVHVHDIFWPQDYPSQWAGRLYSEQYLLAARLLTPDPGLEIVFPSAHVFGNRDLLSRTSPLWQHSAMEGVRAGWGSFWFRTR